jgi:hypothetical protein
VEEKMLGWQEYYVERERRHDEMRQAKKERLVHQALETKVGFASDVGLWMNHLGTWLVAVGSNLQARYAAEAS